MTLLLWCRWCVERGQAFRFAMALGGMIVTVQSMSAYAETKIIPSAIVRGQYDTNVFNRPAQFLPSGTQTSDFLTTVGGAVNLLHETRDIEARLKVGGNFNTFVENTGLNYFDTALQGALILDRWVDQYTRGAKLQVTEYFTYTPASPSFVTGARVQAEDDTFSRGIQGFRANTFQNTTSIKGSYPVSRDLSLEGGYLFALRRQGQIQGGGTIGGVNFFDTNTHTWSGGPRYQLTRNDSIAAVYRQSFITQSVATGGRQFNTNLISLLGDYTKVFPEWSFTVEGGVTFVEPANRTFPSGSITITTQPERMTVLSLTLSREAKPSFFIQGGATISNLGRVAVSHRIYERLTLDGGATYGYNQLFPNTDQTFKNFTAFAGFHYNLTRNITGDLFYSFTHIDVERTGLEYKFSRNLVGITLTAEWN